MKTICLYIPGESYSHANAITDTHWNVGKASIFANLLEEVHASVNEEFSLELYCHHQTFRFCINASEHTIDVLKASIYTAFNQAHIVEIPDPIQQFSSHAEIEVADAHCKFDSIIPIRTFADFKTDSLAMPLALMSCAHPELHCFCHLIVKPIRDSTRFQGELRSRWAKTKMSHLFKTKFWFKREKGREVHTAVTTKIKRKLFRSTLRFGVACERNAATTQTAVEQVFLAMTNPGSLSTALRELYLAYRSLGTSSKNTLEIGPTITGMAARMRLQKRQILKPELLYSDEVASLWHPPSLGSAPGATAVLAKRGAAPNSLPTTPSDDVSFFGETSFREIRIPFGVLREDRRRHMYVVGKTGVGKSSLLQLLAKSDIDQGRGLAILDPHGDLVDEVLRFVPPSRVKDVILLDPGDLRFPVSFNPVEFVPLEMRHRVASSFLETFRKLFSEPWSDRLELVMRECVLLLLASRGTTLLSIPRILQDEAYRKKLLQTVDDDQLVQFWTKEFPNIASQYASQAITPIIERVSQFLSTDMIRNIVGQPVSKFHFREIVDNRHILLMKISKGTLGDRNASFFGSLIVSKIFEAALSRNDTPEAQREDFSFYVDEFHHFATSQFAEILSEARKYRLNLTIANQFLSQLPEDLVKGIFGNVATIIGMRVGGNDAGILASQFAPRFDADDLVNLALRDFYVKMSIRGQTPEAFSGRTLTLEYPARNYIEESVDYSRSHYALPVEHVHQVIDRIQQGRVAI